jgi:serine/threonine-protein kinase
MHDVLTRLTTALADRYRVERELGAGGMATVYLAHDLKHERDVAIKVLHPDLGAALGADRFLSEIKTTARLQHPHILPLLDSGAADGLLYYVMPFVRGETLRARLERETQLPLPDVMRIATEVAEALQVAHAAGIVHRDIKPENILLQDDHAVVADFGIALAVQQAGGQRMTQTGLSLGTPQYMSPEQAMGEKAVDARADIYALGAMTYEMLTGDPPFTGSSVQAIVARVLTERPASIRAVRDTVPEPVEAAVLTALAKLPADRFATARAFAEALKQRGNSTTVTAAPIMAARRTSALAWLLRAAAVLAVGAAGYVGGRQTQPVTGSAAANPVLRFPVSVDSPYRATSLGAAMLQDGSGFAFIGDGPPGHGIYVRRLGDTLYQYLPLADASIGVIPTPDGQSLLNYVFTRNSFSRVMIVPLNGNPPRAWTDSLRFGLAVDEQGWVWASHHAIDGLMRVSPDNASAQLLTRPDTADGETSHRFPVLLPGGRGALFSIGYLDGRPVQMALYDAKRKAITRLGAGTPTALIGGKYLVFVGADRALSAQRFDLDQLRPVGPIVPLLNRATNGQEVFTVTTSPSGNAIYFVRRPGSWSIASSEGDKRVSLVGATGDAPVYFRLAPDGQSAAVATSDGIAFHGADGSVRRVSLGGPVELSNYLPDGSGLLFIRSGSVGRNEKRGTPEVAPADGAAAPRPFDNGGAPIGAVTDGRFVTGTAVAAPGGAIVLNGSGDPRTRGLLFLPRGGGPAVQISAMGSGAEPSPDGRFVAWTRLANNDNFRRVVMVTALPPAQGTWEVGPGTTPRWSADSRALYFAEPRLPYDQRAASVFKVAVDAGPTFRFSAPSLAASPPPGALPVWDVNGANGKVYWLTTTSTQEMQFVSNFAKLVDSVVTQASAQVAGAGK